jgi:hypothetical protein
MQAGWRSLYLLLICAAFVSSLVCGGSCGGGSLSGLLLLTGDLNLLLAIAIGGLVSLRLAACHVHALLVLGASLVDALPACHLVALHLGAVAAVLLVEFAESLLQLLTWLRHEGVGQLLVVVCGGELAHLKAVLYNSNLSGCSKCA